MSTHVSKLMSMLAAQTIRNGGEFAGPDYDEEDILDELEAEAGEE